MALFSTTTALKNLKNLKSKRAEVPNKNFEYRNFKAYKTAGGEANSLVEWDRKDGKWLRADRESCNQFWKNAVISILKDPINKKGRLTPFEQVSDFYHYTQVLVKYRKHQTQWLFGAYYLVSDLADAYDRGATVDMLQLIIDPFILTVIGFDNLKSLLAALNVAIADYAITQFYRLLYGEYRMKPRTGLNAWKFDKQFILSEQIPTAFGVYSDSKYSDGISLEDQIFNKKGFFVGYDLVVDVAFIPVYPDQYNSVLSLNNGTHPRFGEESRVLIPLAMLYPNQYFYLDDINDDTEDQDYSYSFKGTKFGQTLKRGHDKYFKDKTLDKDSNIFMSYYIINRYLKHVFYA